MKILVKNMVCDRCTFVIRNVLRDLDIEAVDLRLGEVDLGDQVLDDAKFSAFKERIEELGFGLVNDRARA